MLRTEPEGAPFIYLDNAATTHKPQQVIDALVNFYAHHNSTVHRGIYPMAEQATSSYEHARLTVAQFIGAEDASEIVFTRGTTESINCVVAAWAEQALTAGDEILVTELEHHANFLPWQQSALKKGAVLKIVPVLADGTLAMAAIAHLLTKKTKLVAVTHLSNALGTEVDVASILKAAHAVGARVLIDAAQSVPHRRLNVAELGADFVAFSGHKMLGPTGIGVLYIKKELHPYLVPYQYGGGMVYEADYEGSRWQKMPYLLEAGTPPIAEAIGLAAAIDYLQEQVDFDQLEKYEAGLCSQLIDGLSDLSAVRILGPVEQLRRKGHLVSFIVDGHHAHDVAAYLATQGIAVRAGHHCAQPLAKRLGVGSSVRVSVYGYTTPEEIEMLLVALKKLLS
jgi:cysteine desulfurase/selenocysteine lyase